MIKFVKILIFLLPFGGFAQAKTLDSLKLALKAAKNDTARCTILNTMIETESDLTLVTKYNNDIITICEVHLSRLKPTQPEYLKFKKHYAKALCVIGNVLDLQNQSTKAIDYYLKALKVLNEIDDKKLINIILNNVATIYDKQGLIQKSLEYHFQSLKIKEELKDNLGIGYSLSNIGVIYDNVGDKQKASDYYNKSLKIREAINDQEGIAQSLTNIGRLYLAKNCLLEALTYFEKSLKISELIDNKKGMTISLANIGHAYIEKGDYKSALIHYNKSLMIAKNIKNKYYIAISSRDIGFAYFKQKNYSKALEYSFNSMTLIKELGYPNEIAKASKQLTLICKATGDYKNALLNYELYVQMRDSINNQETKKASIKSQLKYEYEKKAAADSVKVGEEKKLTTVKLKQEKTQRYFLYGGLGLTALFGLFMFNRFIITQKQKNIIDEQKTIVENQKHLVEVKQKEVLDSICYAKRIQQSLMPTEKYIERILKK